MIGLKANDTFAQEHYTLVRDSLNTAIDHILQHRGLKAAKVRQRMQLENDLETFLRKLRTGDELKQLITTPAVRLGDVAAQVRLDVPSLLDKTKDSLALCVYIFIERVYNPFNKYKFIKRLELGTCLYCNRNYIYYLKKHERVKPQLDHFLPKSKYPYLGMSYYNLIPSCQTCNGPECKGNQDPLAKGTRLINPYEVKSGDFTFSYDIISSDYAKGVNKDAFSVSIGTTYSEQLKVFKLEGLYAKHTDHVAELFVKACLNYAPQYRDYLINSYKQLGLSNHEINHMIIGNYTDEDDLAKRPLAKLYRDIAEDLGLLK